MRIIECLNYVNTPSFNFILRRDDEHSLRALHVVIQLGKSNNLQEKHILRRWNIDDRQLLRV